MIDDINCPVECASKNSAPCLSTLSKTALRSLVTTGESGITHQVVAQVVAQPLNEEGRAAGPWQSWSRRAAAERDETVQIELVPRKGRGNSGIRPSGSVGNEDAIEHRLNQQRHVPCAAPASAISTTEMRICGQYLRPYDSEAQQLLHAGTRRRWSAPST